MELVKTAFSAVFLSVLVIGGLLLARYVKIPAAVEAVTE